tara:strand:+ start:167 stop:736 length:570 start_codon:yes stop_codon:yes gene_type:complete
MNRNNNLQRVLGVHRPKKAQEEMVGFVLIVVLISIAGVIFLGISLRDSGDEVVDESNQIYSLIGGLSQLTSKCEIPESNFLDVSNLIRECVNGRECSACDGDSCGDTGSACEVLENTLKEAMEASYVVSDRSYARHYNLSVYYEFDSRQVIEPILEGDVGNCFGRKLFNNRQFNAEERVILSLEVCFSD